MRYLGFAPRKLRVGVFELTSCEGCELQLANKEETLVPFLSALEIAAFREISSAPPEPYEIAFVEGAVTRDEEVERVKVIRDKAKVVVAFGTCACFGGVARQKNALDPETTRREVYGDHEVDTGPARPVGAVIKVDLEIPGCPVSKDEVERIVRHLMMDVPYQPPVYPVCIECKQEQSTCNFLQGRLCLGSVTRAGCGAPCSIHGTGCSGCRGAAPAADLEVFKAVCKEAGFVARDVNDRLAFYGGFDEVAS